jgi:hypothetical protein
MPTGTVRRVCNILEPWSKFFERVLTEERFTPRSCSGDPLVKVPLSDYANCVKGTTQLGDALHCRLLVSGE